jgi:hypothetical protein
MVTCLWVSGCAVSSSNYRDPQALGHVPLQAEPRSWGLVGSLSKLGLAAGEVTEPGTVILVAGEEPILSETVAASDRIRAEVTPGWMGEHQVCLEVNGSVVGRASSKAGAYRFYFAPAYR